MYTATRRADGRLVFETHEPPESLSPAEARRALEALASFRRVLEQASGICARGPTTQRSRLRAIQSSAIPTTSPTTAPTPDPAATPTQRSSR